MCPDVGRGPLVFLPHKAPYKLAIIGAGPAGVAILVRAVRLGLLDELLGPDPQDAKTAGVVMLEKGPSSRVGGGSLAEYAINSNTNAVKFAKNVLSDRLDVVPQERVTGTVLEPLRRSHAARMLERLGFQNGPLQLIGSFLGEVGQVMRSVLDFHPESACICNCEVVSLQRASGGVMRIALRPSRPAQGMATTTATTLRSQIYARKVVIAAGGEQAMPVRHMQSFQRDRERERKRLFALVRRCLTSIISCWLLLAIAGLVQPIPHKETLLLRGHPHLFGGGEAP